LERLVTACSHTTLVNGGGQPTPSSLDPLRPVCAWCGEPFDGDSETQRLLKFWHDRRPQPWDWR